MRIHRSAGINLAHVRAVRRGKAKGLEVELSDGVRLPISRRKAREVVELLRRSRERKQDAPTLTPDVDTA